MRAQWATDLLIGRDLELYGRELSHTACLRRCSLPVNLGVSDHKCTKDLGHGGPCECNVARDIEGDGESPDF